VLELQRLLKDDDAPIEMRFAPNQAKFSFAGMEFVSKLVEGAESRDETPQSMMQRS
jgi:DNA polymerase-3 subunit beta